MATEAIQSWIKRCATCEYWDGPREAILCGTAVEVDNLRDVNNRAECFNHKAQYYMAGRPAANSCCGIHYLKWYKLK